MKLTKFDCHYQLQHPIQSLVVRKALYRSIILTNTLLLEFCDLSGSDEGRRQVLEEIITELLQIRDGLEPVLDSDGFIRNWLVDVVREVRRGNPGAARFELQLVSRRLEAVCTQWGRPLEGG